MQENLDTWFKREVLVHEAALLRFLKRNWSNRQDVADLRQDIYIRIYEAAKIDRPKSPRAFLFVTARHMLADRMRRRRIISIEAFGDLEALNVSIDEISPERRLDSRQQLKRLAQALNALPPRCRQVIWMRRIDELSQKEVAQRLGISVRTVESHLLNGMHLLANAFLGGKLTSKGSSDPATHESESDHGQHQAD